MTVWHVDAERLGRAVTLAADLHGRQVRKGTDVPYISHLFAVAGLAAEDGADNDTILAALLHDAAEDQGGEDTLRRIQDDFGARVSDLVRECSDALPRVGQAKSPWRARKEAMIAGMPAMSRDALLIMAADKLHNVRSTAADHRSVGDQVWERFKTGRAGFVWYHEAVLSKLEELIPDSRSVLLLRRELSEL